MSRLIIVESRRNLFLNVRIENSISMTELAETEIDLQIFHGRREQFKLCSKKLFVKFLFKFLARIKMQKKFYSSLQKPDLTDFLISQGHEKDQFLIKWWFIRGSFLQSFLGKIVN